MFNVVKKDCFRALSFDVRSEKGKRGKEVLFLGSSIFRFLKRQIFY